MTERTRKRTAENDNGTTARDQVLLSRISKIQHKVDSLEQTTAFSLRADSKRHLAEVQKIFGKSRRRARVYLATNGARSVQDLAECLGMPRPNVSVELLRLADEGLLEVVDSRGNSTIYAKTALARTLRIPSFVCEEFSLDRDGFKVGRRKPRKVTRRSRR